MIALCLALWLPAAHAAPRSPAPAMSLPANAWAQWLVEPARSKREGAEVTLWSDPDGRVWLSAGHRAFFVPQQDALFRADRPVQQVIWLGHGQLARSYSALGRFQFFERAEGGMPEISFQPLTMVPLKSWRMAPAEESSIYVSGYNPDLRLWQVALVGPDAGANGPIKVLFGSKAPIADVAGAGRRVYYAVGRAIWAQDREGTPWVYFAHKRAAIRKIVASPSGGVFYATDEGVGFAGEKGGFDFLRASRCQVATGGGYLFVMPGPLSAGVLRIGGLDRFAALAR